MKENKKKIIIISLISILIVIIITIAVCFIIKNKNQQKEAKAFNKEAADNQLKDYEEGNFNFHDIKVIPLLFFITNKYLSDGIEISE